MFEVSALVKLLFFVCTLCYLALHAGGLAQESTTPTGPAAPSEVCAAYTLADDRTACYVQYVAERKYEEHTDPNRAALYTAFPVLAVVFMAYLAAKLAGL